MIWPKSNQEIVLMILSHEGGFVNNPNDKGGPTHFGVTIDALASFRKTSVTAKDIQNLTVQEASALYLQKYIIGPNFDQLADVRLRTAMADFGVLFGPIRAIQSLQSLLKLPQDGILGPNSIAAANKITWVPTGTSGYFDSRVIINQLSVARIDFHVDRATAHPDQLVFLKGWISRALTFIE